MNNVLTIAGRELKAYIVSPLAWLIIALFAALTGFIFVGGVLSSRQADLTPMFGLFVVLALILAPALTMRLFSEEYKLGTMELLLTSPARDWQIVVGKYLAAWVGFAILLVPTLWQVLILKRYGDPDMGILGSSYIGVLLLGAAFVGIGMLASALTQNQFVAYIIGVIILLFLWFASTPTGLMGQTDVIGIILRQISMPEHFQDFFSGVLDLQHVMYFVSLALISIVVTTLIVSSRRWR